MSCVPHHKTGRTSAHWTSVRWELFWCLLFRTTIWPCCSLNDVPCCRAFALSKVFEDEVIWRREKDILWALEKERKPHPNVCGLAWICREKLTIALKPLLPGSCSLSQYMEDMRCIPGRPELKNYERLGIAEKVADALRHLHNREISHNDVQPSNIVLGRNPKDDVLLVDFGQACKFSKRFYSSNTPLRYAPPEVLQGGGVSTRGEVTGYFFFVVRLTCQETVRLVALSCSFVHHS